MINHTIDGHDKLPLKVCEPSSKKVIEEPPKGAQSIIDILDDEPNPIECMVIPHSPFFVSIF